MKTFDLKSLPGWIGTGLVILTTSLWTFWGTSEMFYEGWWGTWSNRLVYLIPCAICMAFTLAAIRYPGLGGWILVAGGTLFTVWWWGESILGGTFTFTRLVGQFPLSALLIITGLLFLYEKKYQRRHKDRPVSTNWWIRNIRIVVASGLPLVILLVVVVSNLPTVISRVDDGNRGARLIEGNGVSLIWAPEGPGWNWKQSWGGYPSWNSIAFYGLPPVGIDKSTEDKPSYSASAEEMQSISVCNYLDESGMTLLEQPQNIWRMPTVDELVRSLVLHGQNAGCSWDGESNRAVCDLNPDKETPLWAPDLAPIYYWAADEWDDEQAYYVSFNGWVHTQPKTWGNPRHGYRCVKEP